MLGRRRSNDDKIIADRLARGRDRLFEIGYGKIVRENLDNIERVPCGGKTEFRIRRANRRVLGRRYVLPLARDGIRAQAAVVRIVRRTADLFAGSRDRHVIFAGGKTRDVHRYIERTRRIVRLNEVLGGIVKLNDNVKIRNFRDSAYRYRRYRMVVRKIEPEEIDVGTLADNPRAEFFRIGKNKFRRRRRRSGVIVGPISEFAPENRNIVFRIVCAAVGPFRPLRQLRKIRAPHNRGPAVRAVVVLRRILAVVREP